MWPAAWGGRMAGEHGARQDRQVHVGISHPTRVYVFPWDGNITLGS